MLRAIVFVCAIVISGIVGAPEAQAQGGPDLAGLLGQAQRFTVKVRSTVSWPFAPEQVGTALGTGFIIDREKGLVLTNAHVARRSPATVEIALGDSENEWLLVQRLYVDNHLDIAVLKIDADKLPADATAAKLGCRQPVNQGATVVAYGHPISLSFTATRGIVSSVRTINSHEFVQMDANINPGNSGGPLLAAEVGEVIGINTANIAGAPGLGLALAIRHVCPVLELLARGLDPSLPSLPIYWLKQGRVETTIVAAPFPVRTEGEMGLLPGDVVTGLDGTGRLAGLPDLNTALRGRTGTVTVEVLRNGSMIKVPIKLIAARTALKRRALTFGGMMVTERNTLDAAETRLPPLRVEFIKPGEAASRIGFGTWDQLEQVGGRRFNTVTDLYAWLKGVNTADKIAILVRRSSGSDPRISADYYRFEIQPTDPKLLSAED